MKEKIFNLYFVVNNNKVTELRYKIYEIDGREEDKIKYLYSRAKDDYYIAEVLPPPQRENGDLMLYEELVKLERFNLHFQFFEEVFLAYSAPENPLVCVTKVIDNIIKN